MRVLRVASVTLALVSLGAIANARQEQNADAQQAARAVSTAAPRTLTSRAAVRKAQLSSVLVVTRANDDGVLRTAPAELVIAHADATDPWTGDPIRATRSYAALDETDPWSGERIAVRGARPTADRSDPWR